VWAAGEDVGVARRVAVPAVMVVVICLLFWAGWHNLRNRRLAMQQAQQASITVTKGGDSAPAQDTLRGKMAPGFSLLDTAGKKVSLSDYKGRPVVVNFWATWCGPCKLEMPWFEEFHTKYKSQGLEVLGISEDDGAPKDDIIKSAQKVGVTYPILLTDGKVSKAYGGVDYLPETFYIDKTGNVVVETAGAPSKDEMEANIRKTIGTGL
jgi:peroxiredoxin